MMIAAGHDQPEAQSGCPIANTYTPAGVRALLEGFDVIDLRQDHIFSFIVEKYVKYEYERQPWVAAMPDDMFRALEQAMGWHMLIRCKLSE